jgi:hypothetical protein
MVGTSTPAPRCVYTSSTLRRMEAHYRFDENSYSALGRAGIGWQVAQQILGAARKVRRHIGAVLHIAARAEDGRWIVVALIEETDDAYLVVSARELEADEARTVARLVEGGNQ